VQSFRNLALGTLCVLLPACGTGVRAGPVGLINGPSGDFADTQSSGVTVGALAELQLALVSVTGEIDWTRFSAREVSGVETDDVELWEVAVGGRFFTGPLIIGGSLGYLTGGDVSADQIIRPEVGLRLGRLDLLARYRLGGDMNWWSLGAAYAIR
jgi:hypothetical protein